MLKRFLAIIIACGIIFGTSQAAAPALAAPAVAIGTLEALIITVTLAAALGMITMAQKKEYHDQINGEIQSIKTATAEAMQATLRGTATLISTINSVVKGEVCSSCMASDRRAAVRAGSVDRRASPRCDGGMDECCQDFFKKFRGQMDRGRGGIRIYKNRHKVACCLEWDHLHGGFEVFDTRGNHMGERGCEDLTDDPCSMTSARGKHALPRSATHKPRSPMCQH